MHLTHVNSIAGLPLLWFNRADLLSKDIILGALGHHFTHHLHCGFAGACLGELSLSCPPKPENVQITEIQGWWMRGDFGGTLPPLEVSLVLKRRRASHPVSAISEWSSAGKLLGRGLTCWHGHTAL